MGPGCQSQTNSTETSETKPKQTSNQNEPQETFTKPFENARLPHQLPRSETMRKPTTNDWFEDVTRESGIAFHYRDGSKDAAYTLLESVGGGASLIDYNQDGLLDIYITGGGFLTFPNMKGRSGCLYENHGDWKFVDVTEKAGLKDDSVYTHGSTVADIDRDGLPDLLVTGFQGAKLYRCKPDATFEDWTDQSGLKLDDSWNVSGTFADFNNDGWLDLYVITYAQWEYDDRVKCINDKQLRDVCGPTRYEGASDRLFVNNGDGTFKEVTRDAGLVESNRGLGIVACDFDENGFIDFYVVNDVQANQLYMNQGKLPFVNEGDLAGVAYSRKGERQGSMGVDVGDYNNDGRPDIFYANYAMEDNSLLEKIEGFGFLNVTESVGFVGCSRRWVGFGAGFADFDGDGWKDLVINNGHVAYDRQDSPYFQPSQLFRNDEGNRFVEVSEKIAPSFELLKSGRGIAIGDLDNNGTPDLVCVYQNDPVVLLKNRNTILHWISIRLKGTKSNTDAIGARLTVTQSFNDSQESQTDWVTGGGGYLGSFDQRILFALKSQALIDVEVVWPGGMKEKFLQLKPNQIHTLSEGTAKP